MGTNTRRAFVWRAAALAAGGSALLASAPAPTAESYSRTLGADDRIRFGLVGCGALYYYLMADSSYAFRRFNMQGVLIASFIRGTRNACGDEDKGWRQEVAIPCLNCEEMAKRPAPRTTRTANLNRRDGVQPDCRLGMRSDSGQHQPNPHAPSRFGQLVFVLDGK
jgi:hypothetical protein